MPSPEAVLAIGEDALSMARKLAQSCGCADKILQEADMFLGPAGRQTAKLVAQLADHSSTAVVADRTIEFDPAIYADPLRLQAAERVAAESPLEGPRQILGQAKQLLRDLAANADGKGRFSDLATADAAEQASREVPLGNSQLDVSARRVAMMIGSDRLALPINKYLIRDSLKGRDFDGLTYINSFRKSFDEALVKTLGKSSGVATQGLDAFQYLDSRAAEHIGWAMSSLEKGQGLALENTEVVDRGMKFTAGNIRKVMESVAKVEELSPIQMRDYSMVAAASLPERLGTPLLQLTHGSEAGAPTYSTAVRNSVKLVYPWNADGLEKRVAQNAVALFETGKKAAV